MDIFIYIILYSMDIFMTYQLCNSYAGKKSEYKIKNILWLISISVVLCLVNYFEIIRLDIINHFLIFSLICIYTNKFLKSIQEKLALFLIIDISIYVLQTFILIFSIFLPIKDVLLISIVCQVIYVIFVVIFCNLPLYLVFNVVKRERVITMLLLSIALIYHILILQNFSVLNIPDFFLNLICALITILVLFITIYKIHGYTNKFLAHYHDMKNILLSIYIIANKSNSVERIEENINYFCESLELGFDTDMSYKTDESNQDMILEFIKNKQLKLDKNIYIYSEIKYYEHNVFLPMAILLQMLGIMLDNAIEASPMDKEINVYLLSGENNLIIEVSNYYMGAIDIRSLFKKRFSSKKDKLLHGYGLNNLTRIVQKHNGTVNVKKKNHRIIFSAEFIT